MIKLSQRGVLAAALLAAAVFPARAEQPLNTILMGVGRSDFYVSSHDMTGPSGTTPAGIRTSASNKTIYVFAYDRRFDGPWSVTFEGGLPPVLRLQSGGTAAALGEIGTVRAWLPALLGTYTWESGRFAAHAGAGLHYTFFTDGFVNATYDGAFGGISNEVKFSSSLGPALKVGTSWSLDRNWLIDLSYSKYWIRTTARATTATPGLGNVEREIDLRARPATVSLTAGYRF